MSSFHKIYALLPAHERRRGLLLIGLMLVGMALEMLGIGLIIPATAMLVREDFGAAYPQVTRFAAIFGTPTTSLIASVGLSILVLAYCVKTCFLALLARRQMRFAFDLQVEISQRLYRTYLAQPYSFHLRRNSAQLILNVVNETNLLTFNATLPAMLLFTEALVISGLMALLLYVEPRATVLLVAVLCGSSLVFSRIMRRHIDGAAVRRQRYEGLRLQSLQQGLGGAKEAKLLGREEDFLKDYGVYNRSAAEAGRLQQTLQQLPRLWLELAGMVALAAVLGAALAEGREPVTFVPTLALFAAAAIRLMPSGNRVLTSLQSLRYATPLISTLYSELQLPIPARAVSRHRARPLQSEIRLTGVSYCYPGASSPALSALTLHIPRGEIVGFVGPSGAGKSTLVDLILGLLMPTQGQVEVDGRDIQQDLRGWQSGIGYVPQSIYLMDDSIRRNVAFGLGEAEIDDEAVRRALRLAQLDDFVSGLPEAWHTLVGERGVRLSGGQRQRIGIARALYHDPPVLVLDEATSALDVGTEAGVMQSVTALRGSKTILIVAHRLSSVEQCDRLFRLEAGRLVSETCEPAGTRVSLT